jgi:hypothetical protein
MASQTPSIGARSGSRAGIGAVWILPLLVCDLDGAMGVPCCNPSFPWDFVTGYGGNPRYSRYRVQILRCWVQTVAGAKMLGAKTEATTIKGGGSASQSSK